MSELLNNTPESIEQDGIPQVSFTLEVYNTVQAPVDTTLSIRGQAADAYETGVAIAAVRSDLQEEIDTAVSAVAAVFGIMFPVGSIYVSTSDTAPTFGGENWNWKEVKIPVDQGDLIDGFRGYAELEEGEEPGEDHLHFWLRIEDTEVTA